MPLSLHLFIHFSLAIFVGYFSGRYFKKIWLGVFIGFCGGFLIDLDHVLEYFFVYGPHFNFQYFFQGRQFLISNQIYLWFHAWEYVPILLLLAWLLKKKKIFLTILITLALALSVHLVSDSFINKFPPKFYSLINRARLNFSAEKLLSPEEYQKNRETKQELGL